MSSTKIESILNVSLAMKNLMSLTEQELQQISSIVIICSQTGKNELKES